MIDLKKLRRFYKLKNMVRYNNMTRTTEENVAEHSYYVVLFAHMICNSINCDAETTVEVLSYALSHDLPEIYISDIPHPVKSGNPTLGALLNKLEISSMEQHMPEYCECYSNGIHRDNELVSTVVDLADILSVIQYAHIQVEIGNNFFRDVFDSSYERYEECRKHLSELIGFNFILFESLDNKAKDAV